MPLSNLLKPNKSLYNLTFRIKHKPSVFDIPKTSIVDSSQPSIHLTLCFSVDVSSLAPWALVKCRAGLRWSSPRHLLLKHRPCFCRHKICGFTLQS